jgi:hypothetical protein
MGPDDVLKLREIKRGLQTGTCRDAILQKRNEELSRTRSLFARGALDVTSSLVSTHPWFDAAESLGQLPIFFAARIATAFSSMLQFSG